MDATHIVIDEVPDLFGGPVHTGFFHIIIVVSGTLNGLKESGGES
jgi:hypothetical protein